MHGRALRGWLLLGLVGLCGLPLWTAGCASGRGAPSTPGAELVPGEASVVVRVRNNLVPRRSVVISVLAGTRPERVLGTLPSDDTAAWLVETRLFPGSFVILAQIDGRRRLVSRPIDQMGRAIVTWDLNQDIVRVERP